MDSDERRQHTPGRPFLTYVDSQFYRDYATAEERGWGLPAARREGRVTTVDWRPDGFRGGPGGWGDPVPDGRVCRRVTRALCWLPGRASDWSYERDLDKTGPSWREIRIDRLFGRIGLMVITEYLEIPGKQP